MSQRKSAFAMTAQEQQRYIHVIGELNSGPQPTQYAQFVAIHADMSHRMHRGMGGPVGVERFLPWHRDFLLKLEQAMQQVDPAAFIPYWQWSYNRSIPPWIKSFKPTVAIPATPMSPPDTVKVTRHPHKPAALPTGAQIHTLDSTSSLDFTQFVNLLESYHDTVHMWVGGTMSDIMVAPADPIFWLNHAEVDRIWSVWQAIPDNAGKGPQLSPTDSVLDPWDPDTVATVSSIAGLGYQYV